jgi:hypothetical protein
MAAEHTVLPHDEWIEARKAFLVREKEFTRQRAALAQERRDLPWEAVTKEYVFDGPDGKATLPDLFDGRRQLIVYHFMFPPEKDSARSSRTDRGRCSTPTRRMPAASTRSTGPTSSSISPPWAATNPPRAILSSGSDVMTSTAADPDSPDRNTGISVTTGEPFMPGGP